MIFKDVNNMETKLNIAEILKDKPQGTKLYDLLRNMNVKLDTISTTETVVWCSNKTDNKTNYLCCYSEFGTVRGCPDGLQILKPSKKMQEWSKFAWKKGDVLVNKIKTIFIIFEGFEDDNYTTFKGKHCLTTVGNEKEYTNKESNFLVSLFDKAKEDDAQTYITTIGVKLGGKLNRETLEIEQWKSKFNDGDIVVLDANKCYAKCILIIRGDLKIYNQEECISYYTFYNTECCNMDLRTSDVSIEYSHLRLATDSEKQQLFNALAKKGKRWDAKKKQVVNLKPKADKLKPFDKVLVKDEYYGSWEPAFFWKEVDVEDLHPYMIIGGKRYRYCEPYEGNENLLDY